MTRRYSSLPNLKEEEDEEEESDKEVEPLHAKSAPPIFNRKLNIKNPNLLDVDFLRENGFDVIEYLNQGKYGTVYSAMANELAVKFYPIDQFPEGGVIGENVWQSGNQYYVQCSLTGTKVAIKYVPPPQLEPWQDPQEEFENQILLESVGGYMGLLAADFPERIGHPLEEVRKLMKLSHPNLVEIFNVLSDERKGVYIVMEFFDMTLKQWVEGMQENNIRLDNNSIQIFLDQMIDGLSYLHTNNISHNDLHSSNVMVTEDEEGCLLMKIVDFGQSEYFSEYNSPEADIKGLGQLLRLVMTLLDSDHPQFKQALDDFIYTCVTRVFSNMNEVKTEFESMKKILT